MGSNTNILISIAYNRNLGTEEIIVRCQKEAVIIYLLIHLFLSQYMCVCIHICIYIYVFIYKGFSGKTSVRKEYLSRDMNKVKHFFHYLENVSFCN
jgi:hypothetical protein